MFSRTKRLQSLLKYKRVEHQYQFSTIKLSSGEPLTFPLNFSGNGKITDKTSGQICESALEQIYEGDGKEGFKFAYQATLDAFVQKDIDFFRDICEPKLYKEIVKGFDSLDEHELTLEGQNLDQNSNIDLTFDVFNMIYGVKHARHENLRESQYVKKVINFNGISLQVYQPQTFDQSFLKVLYPFLQVGCVFHSQMNILLKGKDGQIVAGQNSSRYHKILFESVNESQEANGLNHIQNLAQSMSGLFGSVGLFTNKGAMKNFMQRLFITKDLTWKIVDIDEHLKGNPHVS